MENELKNLDIRCEENIELEIEKDLGFHDKPTGFQLADVDSILQLQSTAFATNSLLKT